MADINSVVKLEAVGDVAVLTVDNAPVNALSADVRAGLVAGVREAEADAAVQAIVLICAGRTFIAGADITEFGKPPRDPSLSAVIEVLENTGKPVIAAIHGTCLLYTSPSPRDS